jgi:hypothetical protein
MKKQFFTYSIIALSFIFTACSDDDPTPVPVNEEELITTMTITLSPEPNGTDIILKTIDTDGDGGNDPDVTVSGNLISGITYNGSIELLDESNPNDVENITEEVQEESDEHQFFYTVGSGLDVTTSYKDEDGNGLPIGVEFTLVANATSSGDLTFTLRHEPNKSAAGVASGDITNAGGETDITETFSISVE